MLTGPYVVQKGTAREHSMYHTAEKKSNHTCVSNSDLSLVLQYLLCPRVPKCPCHHPHPSHLSPCELSCQKSTRLAYACLPDSIVSEDRESPSKFESFHPALELITKYIYTHTKDYKQLKYYHTEVVIACRKALENQRSEHKAERKISL